MGLRWVVFGGFKEVGSIEVREVGSIEIVSIEVGSMAMELKKLLSREIGSFEFTSIEPGSKSKEVVSKEFDSC